MDTKLFTISGQRVSLQVGDIQNIPSGDFIPGFPFLVKNITENNITVTVITAKGTEIQTVLYPGWNPEVLIGIKGVTESQLQYGY